MILTDADSIDEARCLREVLYLRLLEWKPELKHDLLKLSRYASQLVNHHNWDLTFYKVNRASVQDGTQHGVHAETLMKMRALAGPHGYAVWRAMQINLAERIT